MIPYEHFVLIAHGMDFPDLGETRIRKDIAIDIQKGIITALYDPDQIPPHVPVLDVRPNWVLPGFVDLHTHPVQHRVRAKAGFPLLEWLERYVFPEEEKFSDPVYAERIFRTSFWKAVRHGTTLMAGLLSAHPETLEVAFQVAAEVGLRVILGWVWMETPEAFNRLSLKERVRQIHHQIERWHGKRNRFFVAIAPRFALSCSQACMKVAGDLRAEYDVYVHTHISENPDEVREVQRRFGMGYLDVYDRAGLLGPRTFLAHGVYLWSHELDRIRERGSVVVHCPTANAFLHSGRFPREAARIHGIRLALGSDVGAGWSYSMLTVIRHAYLAYMEPMSHLFYDATRGGALAAGFESLGLIDPGYGADLVVLSPAGGEAEDILSHWAFAEPSPVRGVIIDGRWVTYEEAV